MSFKGTVGAAVVCRNHEKYISKAIDSLLDQSHKIEKIIIVDDNSEDSTVKIIEKYTTKFKNIELIKNNLQLGPSKSSNIAIENLETDFILYTSGDDYSTNNRALDQLRFLLENPNLSCVVSQVNLFSESDITNYSTPQFKITKKRGIELFKELFWHQNFLNASAACFRKEQLYPNLFKTKYLYLQDFDLWMDLSLKNKIGVSDQVVLNYRVSSTSLSQSVNDSIEKLHDMTNELFEIMLTKLQLINYDSLIKIFYQNIKPFLRSNLDKSDIDLLIIFLMLSHRNYNLNQFTIQYILDKYEKNEFLSKLSHYFNINEDSYSILENKLS